MFKLNKKGFTLVELLAVIVVLAIIMIIAIPSVLETSTNAQRGTFKIYAEKVLNKAQEKFQSDSLFGDVTNKKDYGYCYGLKSGLDMTATGNYKGYVIVTLDVHLKPTFYISLTDNKFSIKDLQYSALNTATEFAAPSSTIDDTCPPTFTKPA